MSDTMLSEGERGGDCQLGPPADFRFGTGKEGNLRWD
jgi:hypothetical protein